MIPIMSRMPDGTLVIETDFTAFKAEFDKVDPDDRLKLPDGRLAIKKPDYLLGGFTIMTIHQEVWERMKSGARRQGDSLKTYINRFEQSAEKGRVCRRCGSELREKLQMEGWWSFSCRTCEAKEVWSKTLVGGTQGQGEREKI